MRISRALKSPKETNHSGILSATPETRNKGRLLYFHVEAPALFLALCLIVSFSSSPLAQAQSEVSRAQTTSQIVADVAGEKITTEELEEPLTVRIHELEQQIYNLKRSRLDAIIATTLIGKEAQSQGVDPQTLVDRLTKEGVQISTEEVEKEYQKQRDKSPKVNLQEAELKQRISLSIAQRKAYQKMIEYGLSLREKYPVSVYLEKPNLPHVAIAAGDEPSLGPSNAAVTIIEFTDYECPACRQYHEVAEKLRQAYPDKIRWVSKDFPLEPHEGAKKAAEAARCANEQGKFWDYRNMLFSMTGKPDSQKLLGLASDLGMDIDPFKQCYESGKYADQIARNISQGQSIGINSTPSFVVNGKLITGGPPPEEFKRTIEQEMAAAQGKS